ncbi:MAG: ComEC/Rec2 family competence protein [Candidatus Cryptobacteroides sp.]
MVEERDFAWIGIPFAAGTAAGFILSDTADAGHIRSAASLTYSATIVIALFLLSRRGRGRPLSPAPRLETALMFLVCGLFCAFNSTLCGLVPEVREHGRRLAEALAGFTGLIDRIPFADSRTPALVKALLTGDRSGLSRETVQCFREAGASYILALSGLHLGIIYLFLSRMTSPLGNSPSARVLRYFLTTGASLAYCIVTGAGPSLVRAFLFILAGETAGILHRVKVPALTLMAAMTIQLAIKPEVIASLGFQLSYLAMTGILLVYPRLERIYPESKSRVLKKADPARRIWQSAMLSVSCQLFTGPLVWLRFHTFPSYFIITNLTALPLTSAVMLLSVSAVILSAAGLCPDFLVRLDEYAVTALVFCLKTIASL